MKLTERLNVLIQATSLSQKSGILSLDDAVKAKTAIDIISSGIINQNFASAINVLIEIAVMSQKKGVYSLKDAYMIYLAVNDIESELKNEINKVNEEMTVNETQTPHVLNANDNEDNGETIVSVPPKVLRKNN
jgi:hypothetical protein